MSGSPSTPGTRSPSDSGPHCHPTTCLPRPSLWWSPWSPHAVPPRPRVQDEKADVVTRTLPHQPGRGPLSGYRVHLSPSSLYPLQSEFLEDRGSGSFAALSPVSGTVPAEEAPKESVCKWLSVAAPGSWTALAPLARGEAAALRWCRLPRLSGGGPGIRSWV